MMHKHGEFAGHGCDGAFFTVLFPAGGHLYPPPFEITIWAKSNHKVLRTLNQQSP